MSFPNSCAILLIYLLHIVIRNWRFAINIYILFALSVYINTFISILKHICLVNFFIV